MTSVSAKFKSDHHIQARREYEFVSIKYIINNAYLLNVERVVIAQRYQRRQEPIFESKVGIQNRKCNC